MQKLQRVMNASARLIFYAPKHCSFNSFTGYLSAYVWSLKSFWSPLKYSRAQLLNISLIQFLFYRHPVMICGEITREFFWALQSVSQKLPWGIDPSWRQRHGFGTVFPWALDLPAPKVVLDRNLRHFYSARHFVVTISLYSDFYIVFLQITFIITNCK